MSYVFSRYKHTIYKSHFLPETHLLANPFICLVLFFTSPFLCFFSSLGFLLSYNRILWYIKVNWQPSWIDYTWQCSNICILWPQLNPTFQNLPPSKTMLTCRLLENWIYFALLWPIICTLWEDLTLFFSILPPSRGMNTRLLKTLHQGFWHTEVECNETLQYFNA